MEPFTMAALAALVWKLTSFFKQVTSGAWGAAVTQGVSWGVAIGVMFLAANAGVTDHLAPTGVPLGSLDVGSLVLFGLSLGSVGSAAYDVKSAVDGSDTAVEPKVFNGKLHRT